MGSRKDHNQRCHNINLHGTVAPTTATKYGTDSNCSNKLMKKNIDPGWWCDMHIYTGLSVALARVARPGTSFEIRKLEEFANNMHCSVPVSVAPLSKVLISREDPKIFRTK